MKILAILVLVATIAGAGAVLYGINTLRLQVVQTAADETRAQDAADTFAALVSQLENNTFGGKIFGGTGDLRAEECAFVTYTVRLKNRGFFPAEWISMELLEPAEGDVLGCVLFIGEKDAPNCGELERKLAETAAAFLGKQMES